VVVLDALDDLGLRGVRIDLARGGGAVFAVSTESWETLRAMPDRAALDAEIAYWLKQNNKTRWFLGDQIDRALERSPGLDVHPRELAVGIFQRGMVERIGDPLFGDIRKLAAVFDANVAVLPVGAEYVGASRETARLQIATALIAMDADVKWFGIIEGTESGVDSQAAIASAAQAFARAFADKKRMGEE